MRKSCWIIKVKDFDFKVRTDFAILVIKRKCPFYQLQLGIIAQKSKQVKYYRFYRMKWFGDVHLRAWFFNKVHPVKSPFLPSNKLQRWLSSFQLVFSVYQRFGAEIHDYEIGDCGSWIYVSQPPHCLKPCIDVGDDVFNWVSISWYFSTINPHCMMSHE